jgi:hypothetical protein
MRVNVVYDNSSTRTPSGATVNQPLAGTAAVGITVRQVAPAARRALAGNKDAASVIQSNGELIGNAQLASNPLPPGVVA